MPQRQISHQTLGRLPLYLNYLRILPEDATCVSATQIALAIGLGDVQVRKDLAAVSGQGRPKTGYITKHLLHTVEGLLFSDEIVRFCIVGMGKLGSVLAQYHGFKEYGLHLAALFDIAPQRVAGEIEGMIISPIADMKPICEKLAVQIGIITVPPQQAQDTCNALVDAGVRTIWNFAPTHLAVPQDVYVKHENMAAQLGMLRRHMQKGNHG